MTAAGAALSAASASLLAASCVDGSRVDRAAVRVRLRDGPATPPAGAGRAAWREAGARASSMIFFLGAHRQGGSEE